MDIFTFIAIAVAIIFVYIIFFRNKKAAQKEINNLSEVNYKSHSNITFDDVAGNYEAKESLKELVDFIKNPEKYSDFNVRAPKGVLLYGTPGTGKTLLAQALAGEAGVDFFAVSGSDFVQIYAGLGASRIRNLFNKAKKAQKSVIFIDEIDAIGKKRMGPAGKGSDEGDRTLNALLTEMSGFENSGTIVIAATNRIDTLDSALLRPGRFDRQIEVMLPDKDARKDIIKLYLDKTSSDKNIDIDKIAEITVYFSGAMIENLVNEASILAVKDNSKYVCESHLEKAYFNVIAGVDKKNTTPNETQKEVTAYHEAGHAFISKYLEPDNKIIKVSIIPTTKGAGGYTLSTPENEAIISKDKIKNQIKIFLAGRGVEEVFLGNNNVTIGAQNDIEKATSLARAMVTQYGMSERFGLMGLESVENRYLDGRAVLNCGESTASEIDQEVMAILKSCYDKAKALLSDNKDVLDQIAEFLVEKETITGKEFMKIYNKVKGIEVEENKEDTNEQHLEDSNKHLLDKNKEHQLEDANTSIVNNQETSDSFADTDTSKESDDKDLGKKE